MATNIDLISMIEKTISNSKIFHDSEILKNRKFNLENFKPKIESLSNDLVLYTIQYRSLTKRGCNIETSPQIQHFFDNVKTTRDEVKKYEYNTNYLKSANSEMMRLNAELKLDWVNFINKEIGAFESVINVTKNFIRPDTKTKLDSLLVIIYSNGIATDAQIKAITEFKENGNECINQMNLSVSILEFLKTLSHFGYVTLDVLNEDTLKWLRDSGYSTKFRIIANK